MSYSFDESTAYENIEKSINKCDAKIVEDNTENSEDDEELYEKKESLQEVLSSIISAIKQVDNPEIIVGYAIMVFSGTGTFVSILRTFYSIYTQRNSVVSLSSVYIVFSILFPLISLIILTYYDYWNYHDRKMKFLSLVPAAILASLMRVITITYGVLFRPLVFLIPLQNDSSGMSNIMFISTVINVIIVAIPTIALASFSIRQFMDKDFKKMIFSFKIRKKLDLRKNKAFKYDMRFLRNLETGKAYNIKMEDRTLHSALAGASGTAKTSSSLVPSIVADLNQKVYNDDYLKKSCQYMLEGGLIALNKLFDDRQFSINYFSPLNEEGAKKFEELQAKCPSAGITCVAPNAAFADEIYTYAVNRGMTVNRVDPILDKNGKHKPGFKGFNPLYIPSSMKIRSIEWELDIFKKAKLFADVLQAIYDLSGSSDAYFAKLNKNITTTFTILLEVTMPTLHPGHQVTPDDVQELVCNFDKVKPYYYELLRLYGDHDIFHGKSEPNPNEVKNINCGRYQFIVPVIQNDIINTKGREQLENQIRGLRTIMSDFINNPLIHDTFCVQDSLDLDQALANGEVTVVNYALELGEVESTAFGLFFTLSFNNAVLRRPGTEFTRIPHYYYIDEFTILLHKAHQTMFTMFRQYRVACVVAFQTYDLFDATPTTKYLKGVVMNNTAHQVFYGRVSIDEMRKLVEMTGKEMRLIEQITNSETALTDPETKLSYSTRTTPTMENKREGVEFRNKDFQEVSFFTVDQGNVVGLQDCKLNFLKKKEKKRIVKRYTVDWSKYYVINNSEENNNVIEFPVMQDRVVMTGTDGYSASSVSPNSSVKGSEQSINNIVDFLDTEITNESNNTSKVNIVKENELSEDNNIASIDCSNMILEKIGFESMNDLFPDEEITEENELEQLQHEEEQRQQGINEEAERLAEEEQRAIFENNILDSDADSDAIGDDSFNGMMDD